ncbi:Cytochrome c oxidase subunit 7A [Rhodotorula toruloides]|uniref:Cytochrome c oxidase subunit 9, mitochondrial n=1 Tax=Rhodotorula toruloides TaxID=5286 RepID=A0A0K3CVF5_RHOTO
MAIAPITGMLRKHLLTNLSIGIGGGVVAGYAFWYGVHLPNVRNRDAWYLAYQENKAKAESE